MQLLQKRKNKKVTAQLKAKNKNPSHMTKKCQPFQKPSIYIVDEIPLNPSMHLHISPISVWMQVPLF